MDDIAVEGISIHALVKRATDIDNRLYSLFDISIHALVKRATINFSVVMYKHLHFNPRPREEGD